MNFIQKFQTEEELKNYISKSNSPKDVFAILNIYRRNMYGMDENITEFAVFRNSLNLTGENYKQELRSSASSVVKGYSNIIDWNVSEY